MKKYIALSLCIAGSLYAAQQPTPKIQEWNPELYVRGNKPQYSSALSFLERNNIEIKNKRILDIACGTGEISAFLAQIAQLVDGFDASNNMVQWAQEHHVPSHNNLSFRQCCVEDFYANKQYDLATMFFCFHWFPDKQKALNQISASLKDDGEIFGTFTTSDIPQPPQLAVIAKLMEKWNIPTNLRQSLGRSTVTTKELKILLTNAGFDIITCELQTNNIIFPNRIDVENFARPVIMSRPFMQEMPQEQREKFFTEYIDCLIPVLQNNETNELMLKLYVTIVHARKKVNNS